MTTWKQVVYDVADAYREADGSTAKIPVGSLANKVREGAGTPYTGPNPLTIGADGYSFNPKTLLKNGLTILNGVNGEDLTATEADMALAITELQRMVARKVSDHKGEGQYVWKKYANVDPTAITLTQIVGGNPFKLQITSSVYDLSAVDGSWFIGMKGTYTGVKVYEYTFLDNDTINLNGYDYTFIYDATTQTFTIPANVQNIIPWTVDTAPKPFIDYVVNDDETAYPNNGLLDGYYYEKGESGLYAWEKYEYTTTSKSYTNPTITLNGDASNVKVTTTSGIDLSQVEAEFFNGFTYNNGYVNLVYENNNLYYEDVDKRKYLITWNKSTQTFVVNNFSSSFNTTWNYVGTKTVVATNVGTFVDFVVSDDETAYPNGGEQDGYWYERYVERLTPELFGCTEMAIDKYVPTQDIVSSSATIPHSLNKLPKIGIIIGNPTHLAGNLEKAFACFGIDGTGYATMTRQTTSDYTGVGGKSNTSKATTTTILLYESATWFKAGVEYTIMTLT